MLDNILWDTVEELNHIHRNEDRFRMRFSTHSNSEFEEQHPHTHSGLAGGESGSKAKTFGRRLKASSGVSAVNDWTSNINAPQHTLLSQLPRMRRTVPNTNPLDFTVAPHTLQQLRTFNMLSRIAYDSHRIKSIDDLTEHEKQLILDDEMSIEQTKYNGQYGQYLQQRYSRLQDPDLKKSREDYLRNEMNRLIERGLQRIVQSQSSLDLLSGHAPIDTHDLVTSGRLERIQRDMQQQINMEKTSIDDALKHLDPHAQRRLRHLLIDNGAQRYRFINYLIDKQYRIQQEVMSVFKNKERIYQEPFGPLGLEPPLEAQHPLQFNHTVFNEESSGQQRITRNDNRKAAI